MESNTITGLHFEKIDTILAVFRVRYGGQKCNYAHMAFTCANGKLSPLYSVIGQSYKSADGEYRRGAYKQNDLAKLFEFSLPIAEKVTELFGAGKLLFKVRFFSNHLSDTAEALVQKDRLPIKLMAAAIALNYLMNKMGPDANLNSSLNPLCAAMSNIIDMCFEKGSIEAFAPLLRGRQWGMKLLTISIYEVLGTSDVQYPAWREIYLNEKVTQLLDSNIAPGFAAYLGTFIFHNTNDKVFDNPEISKKFVLSEMGLSIKKRLADVNRLTLIDQKEYERGHHNMQFEKLANKISSAIRHDEKNIIMGPMTTAFISEHVGMPIYNLPGLINTLPELAPIITDHDFLACTVFQLIYSLLALHKRTGIIHGDLHLNNVLVQLGHRSGMKQLNAQFYVPGGDKAYAFANYPAHFKVIDFSRSVVGPLSCIYEDWGSTKEEKILSNHKLLYLRLTAIHYPSLMSAHKEVLPEIVHRFPRHYFKLLSAIDIAQICRSYLSLISGPADIEKGKPPCAPNPRSVALLGKIVSIANNYFIENVLGLIRAHETDGKYAEKAFPAEFVIDKCFDEYQVPLCRTLCMVRCTDSGGACEKVCEAACGDDKDVVAAWIDDATHYDFVSLKVFELDLKDEMANNVKVGKYLGPVYQMDAALVPRKRENRDYVHMINQMYNMDINYSLATSSMNNAAAAMWAF